MSTTFTKADITTPTTPLESTRTTFNCLTDCKCSGARLDCSSLGLIELPVLDPKTLENTTEFLFANNSLITIDLKLFASLRVELLDLSNNSMSRLMPPTKETDELKGLRSLDLSRNSLKSLSDFSRWKMPDLEVLNLAYNKIDRLKTRDFLLKPSIKELNLSMAGRKYRAQQHQMRQLFNDVIKYRLTEAEENFIRSKNLSWLSVVKFNRRMFDSLHKLQSLNLSGNLHLPRNISFKNRHLEVLDLSETHVHAIALSSPSIKRLYLNGNKLEQLTRSFFRDMANLEQLEMSNSFLNSLEKSTFSRTPKLKRVIMTDNKNFSFIHEKAFELDKSFNESKIELDLLDIRNNSLRTLPAEMMSSLKLREAPRLTGNPWCCDCSLRWLNSLQNLTDLQAPRCAEPNDQMTIKQAFSILQQPCQILWTKEFEALFEQFEKLRGSYHSLI